MVESAESTGKPTVEKAPKIIKRRRRFSREFKEEAVHLVCGLTPTAIALRMVDSGVNHGKELNASSAGPPAESGA